MRPAQRELHTLFPFFWWAGCALVLLAGSLHAYAAAPHNQPPTVTLTSPSNGASFFSPATISLAATASDSDGTVVRVDFYQGATLIASSDRSPYTAAWSNVPIGSYTLTAKATDNSGSTTTSPAVLITVESGTALVITSPTDGSALNVHYYDYVTYGVTVSGTFESTFTTGNSILVDNENQSALATVSGTSYTATIFGGQGMNVGANTITARLNRPDKTSVTRSITVYGYDTPVVAFTAPSSGTFTAPANVTFAVDAKAAGGTVTKVDFLNGDTLAGTIWSPPYQITLSNLANGTHTITAIATSNQGANGRAYVTIVVVGPNVPPSIAITSPTGGATFSAPAGIPITVNATDSDGFVKTVDYFANAGLIGSTNVAPFSMTWSNVGVGSYALTARAIDDHAGQTTSAPVNITVVPPNQPPTVTLTSPTQGAVYTAPATITLTATASDPDGTIDKVEYYQGATLVGTSNNIAPYTVNWSVVAPGSYSLTAKAFDNLGASGTSAPVNITVTVNQPPTVALTAPTQGATFNAPATITLSATASDADGTVSTVEFYQGATFIGTATTTAPYTFTWTNVAAGTYALTAKATDNAGASTTSAAVAITVTAPAVVITSPTPGAALNGDRVLVSGTYIGPSNTGITVNGVIAVTDENNNFYANNVRLQAGANTLTATLTTQAGQTATQSVSVNSDGITPAVQISASPLVRIAPLTTTFVITNGGAGDATIQFNGSTIATLPVGNTANTTVTYTTPGTYPVNITATDTQNNTTTRNFVIVVKDAVRVDQMFKGIWSTVATNLAAGSIEPALIIFAPGVRDRYRVVLSNIVPALAGLFSNPPTINLITFDENDVEYFVVMPQNGTNYGYYLYFSQGADGVWRIQSL